MGDSKRIQTLFILTLGAMVSVFILIAGMLLPPETYDVNFAQKAQTPSLVHPFGTDKLGRDMLMRTLKGLSNSIVIGVTASMVSAIMALILGSAAAIFGKKTDFIISWIIDLTMSVPHLILIMLISIACGKGSLGVFVGIASTHWTALARVIRAEVLSLKNAEYIGISRAMGRGELWIARKHILPHIVPQFIIGLILTFPHAILHEAAITFLGFGLPPEQPAVGIILSESMMYLSAGMWWTAVFPGLALLIIVLLFDAIGENIRLMTNPTSAND